MGRREGSVRLSGVFLTGGTGFIGGQVVRGILQQNSLQINVLVRGDNQENAVLRLKRSWWDYPELLKAIGKRVKVFTGDLSKSDFGLDESAYRTLVQSTSYIIHCAANTTPNLSIEELRRINVTGTANVIAFAKDVQRDHGLCRLSHISTAYVAGKRNGSIGEDELDDRFGFSSLYERTKFESEQLISAVESELSISIFRPSLVIGDSKTGAVKIFNTIYYLLKQYLTGHLHFVPTSSKFKVNLVPVDYVANAVVDLTFNKDASGLTFHLTSPFEKTPTAKELLIFTKNWAHENMRLDLPKVTFIPSSGRIIEGILRIQSSFNSSDKKAVNAFHTLSPYFSQSQDFKRENTDRLLGPYTYDWQKYLSSILQYAVYYSFFHRSERTVYEQILFRLQSDTKPIRYHEIINGKLIDYDTSEVKAELLQTEAALNAMGIKKGDVIAIIGYNNHRYLLLDVAAGLLGAVSCPIYVTSPPSEIIKILTEANAKLLFVGTQKILQEITTITTDIPIISFLTTQSSMQTNSRVISWSNFLENAKNTMVSTFAPVDFNDLATVRHTFGSTGEPKGACLNHGNLRYVAESLASNFPWKSRTTKASYLSFLPMNHVAEGITAMYSPYFIPSAMDIYFLEDYHDLPRALKIAKPTVLFAIPRFYEKLWSELELNRLGQQYLKTKNLFKRQFLRRILRFALLRKSGLDECNQFIVGAACISETLLRNFQDLDIEIHNAYGLSEAPLVAMNKLGSNYPGTVGLPLAGTEVRVGNDGEILVYGPQVMRGYLNPRVETPFRDGWLATGDIGEFSSEGHLRILGRKKNIVVTSYGKKIPAEKIEAALKGIEHVTECIVIGDNRPFCSAIVWVDKHYVSSCKEDIDSAVVKLNLELEHPAQIKQFVILESNKSSENKNVETLKIKRQELLKQVEDVIESLYAGSNNSVD